eukprot:3650535-Rhodomonas_salina.6
MVQLCQGAITVQLRGQGTLQLPGPRAQPCRVAQAHWHCRLPVTVPVCGSVTVTLTLPGTQPSAKPVTVNKGLHFILSGNVSPLRVACSTVQHRLSVGPLQEVGKKNLY